MQNQPRCTYCRDPSDAFDHLEPVSRKTSRRRKNKMASCGDRVPCCTLCNSLLGDADVFTIRERAAFLALAYARRFHFDPLAVKDKMEHLIHVAAGFPLSPELEEMEARRRHRLVQIAAERTDDEARELTYADRLRFEVAAHDMRKAQTPKRKRKRTNGVLRLRLSGWFRS